MPNAIFFGLNQLKMIFSSESLLARYAESYTHVDVQFDNEWNPTTGPLKIIPTVNGVQASIDTVEKGNVVFYDHDKDLSVRCITFTNL